MEPGERLKINCVIRSHSTGIVLPQEGTFVRATENLGRYLILVNFGVAGEEYVFPYEIINVRNGEKKEG